MTYFMEYKFRCTDVKDNVKALKTEYSSMDQIIYFWPLAPRNCSTYGLLWYFKRCFEARAQMWYYMHMNYGASSLFQLMRWRRRVCPRVFGEGGCFQGEIWRREAEIGVGGNLILNICHLNWWQICHLDWSCMLSLCLTALSQLHDQMTP